MHSINKNSYLHNYLKDINPRIINRCVEKALGQIITDEHDSEPPFNRLCSDQPNVPVADLDLINRPIGYGLWAMPKLRRELHSKDPKVVIAALESITELAVDSVRGYEALKLRIIDRVVHLLVEEDFALRERTARALFVFSNLADGKMKIVSNKVLMGNIAECVDDLYEEVRLQIAVLLENIAEFWCAADYLIEYGFIPILLHILQWPEEKYIQLIHLRTLRSLLYGMHGKMIVLEYSGFHVLLSLLNNEHYLIVATALECLALLIQTCLGEKLAREVDLLSLLDKLIQDERIEICTQAAHAIIFCTIKATGKILASTYPNMLERLIQLCQNKDNTTTQIYGLKALTNICEHPLVRKRVHKEFYHEIQKIQIGDDPNIAAYKKYLFTVISWSPETST